VTERAQPEHSEKPIEVHEDHQQGSHRAQHLDIVDAGAPALVLLGSDGRG
jgi:hypothetical protein